MEALRIDDFSERVAPVIALFPSVGAPSRFEMLLKRNKLLATLGPEAVRAAAQKARARRFARGEIIWRAGESAAHFQVVVSGMVKLIAPGVGMHPTIVDVFGPGESVGHWAAFEGTAYIGDAVPVTDGVETLLIPAAVLRDAVDRDHLASRAMTNAILAHAHALRAKIGVMCAGSVQQRLAMLLLDLNERFGDVNGDGEVIVSVPLSRQDLSMCVGATIETVIRMMSRWQKEGMLETHPWGFVLRDLSRLNSVLCGRC